MKPYGVGRSFDEYPFFKNNTRKSARRHTNIKKMFHRLARRTWKDNRRNWKAERDIHPLTDL